MTMTEQPEAAPTADSDLHFMSEFLLPVCGKGSTSTGAIADVTCPDCRKVLTTTDAYELAALFADDDFEISQRDEDGHDLRGRVARETGEIRATSLFNRAREIAERAEWSPTVLAAWCAADRALSEQLVCARNAIGEAVHQLEMLVGPLQEDPQFTSLDQEDLARHLDEAARVLRDAHRAYLRA